MNFLGSAEGVLRYPSREGKEARARAHTWLQWEPSSVPAETRARALREAVTAAPPLACHVASGLCLFSGPCFPPRIPCYRAPQSCHLILSFRCQYQSASWAGSPSCRSQHPDPVCTHRRPSQAGAHGAVARTVCAYLTLSAPGPGAVLFPKPLKHPFCLRWSPYW